MQSKQVHVHSSKENNAKLSCQTFDESVGPVEKSKRQTGFSQKRK